MNVELSVAQRAAVHAALGDPVRIAIADALAIGDVSPGDLGRRLDVSSNLLAHHLSVLENAGIVRRTRSEADRRRSYVQLTSIAWPFVTPRLDEGADRVVFVCTHNSARSQLAAALWGSRHPVSAASAGTHPAPRVHPRAVSVARRHGLDLRAARTAHMRDVIRPGDLVVSVCDRAYEESRAAQLHWSVPDPAAQARDEDFDRAFTTLVDRIDRLRSAWIRDVPRTKERGREGQARP